MGKQVVYTQITPLPPNVPRQLALDLLHSHEELIRLNNLVTNVKSISAPSNAEADEYFADWFEITEKISFIPGLPKKKLVFKSCYYNQAWGLQTHTFMPALFEMRCSYRIGGNQEGEPREPAELGVNKPADGLYLREDIHIDVHVPMMGPFVKKEMQEASAVMIARMKRKAELLDEGKLLGMFEDGKLKTTKAAGPEMLDYNPAASPKTDGGLSNGTPQPASRYSYLVRGQSQRSSSGYVPIYQQQGYNGPQAGERQQYSELDGSGGSGTGLGIDFVNELPGSEAPARPRSSTNQNQRQFINELPGSEAGSGAGRSGSASEQSGRNSRHGSTQYTSTAQNAQRVFRGSESQGEMEQRQSGTEIRMVP